MKPSGAIEKICLNFLDQSLAHAALVVYFWSSTSASSKFT